MAGKGLYTEAIAAEICQRIAEGETLNQVCRDAHMPARPTVVSWVLADKKGFADRYARAREIQFETWADEVSEIADDGVNDWVERETETGRNIKEYNGDHVQRSRLRVDSRKWLLAKLKPERYGDSLKLTGELDINHKTDEQLTAQLAQLLNEKGSDSDPGGAGAA
jgi:hypothetical protein